MEIKSVKIQADGYLLNGTVYVSKELENPFYKAVKEWIEKNNTPEPEYTPEELADIETARAKSLAKQTGEVYPLNGVDYQVPFMKDDADGLMQVNAAFQLGITDSVLHFTNGTKMPITAAEFQDFAVWFVTKRNSFFTP